ncbi:MAG: poly(3-hydroxybutyrate) depolymerase, partial [Propionivibrio sp.]
MSALVHFIQLALLALSFSVLAAPPQALPALNIDVKETSVSGVSSGGFMAVQLQVAHSAIIKGAGIIAGGPYYCAQDSVVTATSDCSCTGEPLLSCDVSATSAAVPTLVSATRSFFAAGLIDDPAHIARQRVVTIAGGKDPLVPAPVTAQLHAYYHALGLPPEHLRAVALADAGHTMPTPAYGGACAATEAPYIGKCGFDSAQAILAWIYDSGPPQPSNTGEPQGRFIEFDQSPYIADNGFFGFRWRSGLDRTG